MKKVLVLVLFGFLLAPNSSKALTDNKNSFAITDNQKDSLFLDFFEQFLWDNDFQQSRVAYPIQWHGQVIKDKKHWKPIALQTTAEFIPFLSADTVTIVDKEVKAPFVQVNVLKFDSNESDVYDFSKINTNWYLTKVKTTKLAEAPDREFIDFLIKFSNDAAFQRKSILFPLKSFYLDIGNDFETLSQNISSNDWEYLPLTKDINPIFLLSDNTINNDYRNIYLRGVGTGIWIKYTFKKINKNWKLIKLEDYST